MNKTLNQKSNYLLQNEDGNAAVFGLLGLAALIYLVKYGEVYFESLDPVFYYGTIALLATISLFSMGCSIHMRALGSRPKRQLVKEIFNQIKEFDSIINSAQEQIRHLEEKMICHTDVMSRRGTECLSLLKKIIRAVERRNFDARQLLTTGNRADFFDAYEMFARRLNISQSALESLIDSDPIPPLEPYEVVPAIERLLTEIESEIKKVA